MRQPGSRYGPMGPPASQGSPKAHLSIDHAAQGMQYNELLTRRGRLQAQPQLVAEKAAAERLHSLLQQSQQRNQIEICANL